MNILIIEDDKGLQRSYMRCLGDENQYFCAQSAQEGIDLLYGKDPGHYGLIICDYNLIRSTGREVYHWIAANQTPTLDQFIFVCGTASDVRDLDCHSLWKGDMSTMTDLRKLVNGEKVFLTPEEIKQWQTPS